MPRRGREKFIGCKTILHFTTVSNFIIVIIHCFCNLGKKEFKHSRFGWGVLEAQCDQFGNTQGEGCFICTDMKDSGRFFNLVLMGCFRNDIPNGFGKPFTLFLNNLFKHSKYGHWENNGVASISMATRMAK